MALGLASIVVLNFVGDGVTTSLTASLHDIKRTQGVNLTGKTLDDLTGPFSGVAAGVTAGGIHYTGSFDASGTVVTLVFASAVANGVLDGGAFTFF